jgi:hypothetical protein
VYCTPSRSQDSRSQGSRNVRITLFVEQKVLEVKYWGGKISHLFILGTKYKRILHVNTVEATKARRRRARVKRAKRPLDVYHIIHVLLQLQRFGQLLAYLPWRYAV